MTMLSEPVLGGHAKPGLDRTDHRRTNAREEE
jgi:hypothetical protein